MQKLSDIPIGCPVRLASIDGDRQLVRRLKGLGLSIGGILEVLHRRGRGVVVLSGASRVALGEGTADKLLTENCPQ